MSEYRLELPTTGWDCYKSTIAGFVDILNNQSCIFHKEEYLNELVKCPGFIRYEEKSHWDEIELKWYFRIIAVFDNQDNALIAKLSCL